jgi:hypothetical protein
MDAVKTTSDGDSEGPQVELAGVGEAAIAGSIPNDDARISVDIAMVEYKSLRDEILKKMDNRTALIVSSITVSSAIIGFGVERQSGPLLLIAPLVSILLGTLVSHHNMQIGELSAYIQRNIEEPLSARYPGCIGWHGGRVVFLVRFKHRVLSYHLPLILITVAPVAVTFPLAYSYPEPMLLTVPLVIVNSLILAIYALHIVRHRNRL